MMRNIIQVCIVCYLVMSWANKFCPELKGLHFMLTSSFIGLNYLSDKTAIFNHVMTVVAFKLEDSLQQGWFIFY